MAKGKRAAQARCRKPPLYKHPISGVPNLLQSRNVLFGICPDHSGEGGIGKFDLTTNLQPQLGNHRSQTLAENPATLRQCPSCKHVAYIRVRQRSGEGVVRRNRCPKGCFCRVRCFSALLRFKTPEDLNGAEKQWTLQKHPFGQRFLRMTPSPLLWRAPSVAFHFRSFRFRQSGGSCWSACGSAELSWKRSACQAVLGTHKGQERKDSPKRKFLGRISRGRPGVIRADVPGHKLQAAP